MNWRTFLALCAAAGIRAILVNKYFPDYKILGDPFSLKSFVTDVSAFLLLTAFALALINVFADWMADNRRAGPP